MTVEELIKALQMYNPKSEFVNKRQDGGTDHWFYVGIEIIPTILGHLVLNVSENRNDRRNDES